MKQVSALEYSFCKFDITFKVSNPSYFIIQPCAFLSILNVLKFIFTYESYSTFFQNCQIDVMFLIFCAIIFVSLVWLSVWRLASGWSALFSVFSFWHSSFVFLDNCLTIDSDKILAEDCKPQWVLPTVCHELCDALMFCMVYFSFASNL